MSANVTAGPAKSARMSEQHFGYSGSLQWKEGTSAAKRAIYSIDSILGLMRVVLGQHI